MLRKISVSFLIVLLTMSCDQVSSEKRNAAENPNPSGSVSGGGGFASKNSEVLLQRSIRQLIHKLSILPDSQLSILPAQWDRQKLVQVLKDTEFSYSKRVFREGKELLFNYDIESNKIEALHGFFLAYSWVPKDFQSDKTLHLDLEKKLLHEVSHLFGYNEEKASQFSARLQKALEEDILICEKRRMHGFPVPEVISHEGAVTLGLGPAYVGLSFLELESLPRNRNEVSRRAGSGYFLLKKSTGEGLFVDAGAITLIDQDEKNIAAWFNKRVVKGLFKKYHWDIQFTDERIQAKSESANSNSEVRAKFEISGFLPLDKDQFTLQISYSGKSDYEILEGKEEISCVSSSRFLRPRLETEMPTHISCRSDSEALPKLPINWDCDQSDLRVPGVSLYAKVQGCSYPGSASQVISFRAKDPIYSIESTPISPYVNSRVYHFGKKAFENEEKFIECFLE